VTFSPCDKAHTHEAVEFIQVDRSGELTGIFSGFHYGMGWWMSQGLPGVILDFGLFGSVGWLDIERNTGGYMAIDDSTPQAANVPLRDINSKLACNKCIQIRLCQTRI
jgi:hypothetical protein